MKPRITRFMGFILLSTGIVVIFLSAAINALYNKDFNVMNEFSNEVYFFDLISTAGVILIPIGLVMIMRKEVRNSVEKTYLN